MNKKALLLGGVLGALALAPQAMAQERGWYGAFDLGYHWPEGIETSSENLAVDGSPYKYTFTSEDDLAGFVRLGYQFAPNWRVELEGGARAGDIETIRGNPARLTVPDAVCSPTVPVGPTCAAPQGSVESYTMMANVLYDFFPSSSFRPFIGAGIGVNYVKMDIGGRFNDSPAFGGWRIDDNDTAFAWQFIGGASFDITQRLTADITYRYLDGNDMRFATTYVSVPARHAGSWRHRRPIRRSVPDLRPALQLRPRPPLRRRPRRPSRPRRRRLRRRNRRPPPPPAPMEAKEFIVYFPFDQSILTADAQEVVSAAAQYANSGNATQIVVVGHADTSGSASYNVGLSQRRSKAVADALVGLGVDGSKLSVDWKGETAPAVAHRRRREGAPEPPLDDLDQLLILISD